MSPRRPAPEDVARVAAEREAQGLPSRIDDPAALADLARLLAGPPPVTASNTRRVLAGVPGATPDTPHGSATGGDGDHHHDEAA